MTEDVDRARAALSQALVRAGSGDRTALARVYSASSAKLFGICLRICGEPAGAEDVLQTVYLKIWEQAGRYDPARASPITWMAVIARNSAIDWRRAQGRTAAEPFEPGFDIVDDAPDAEALAIAGSSRARILECMDQLSESPRAAIRAAFYDGLSYPELAARAAVPLCTVKSWVRRALIQLRGCIGDG